MSEELSLGSVAGQMEVENQKPLQEPVYDTLPTEQKEQIDAITATDSQRIWDAGVNMATDFAMGAV